MNAMLCDLAKSEFVRVMHCALEKYKLKKLQIIYEGGNKVKKEKLQTDRGQFESLTMK